jgi:hypothetical protein
LFNDYKFVLIIASEDYTFPTGNGDYRHKEYIKCKQHIRKLLESEKCYHIFVENLDTKHNKLTPIPLGLLTPNIDIKHEQFYNIDFSKKTTLCFVSHRIREGPQWEDRKKATYLCKNNWSSFVKCIDYEIPHEDYILELKKSKFCLCIHGGGYDPNPRFFECILYGTIPIIQRSPIDSIFEKFPVIFIDELNENTLSELFLLQKYEELVEFYQGEKREQVLSLLTLDYWWNKIISRLNE